MISLYDQLMQLRAMTIRTGAIHDAQVLQFKNYPLLVEGVKAATAYPDLERKMIEYKVTKCDKGFPKSKEVFDRDMGFLKKNVQALLWPDTVVVFKLGRRVLYDSRA